jgi:decaprenylphospho-beta-D-ribofuranose 2-oxidase
MSVPATKQVLTGWGRTAPSRAVVAGPLSREQLQELVGGHPPRGVIGRGAGRSYGDAAQNADGYVLAPVTRPHIEVDTARQRVRASASTTFVQLLTTLVPQRLMLPVLPGTRNLTIGGAVAADVHGKNHRRDGSIGAWIDEIEIIDGAGSVRTLTSRDDPEGFWATVGGMGLTGIILSVTMRLIQVRSAMFTTTSRRLPDLDALLSAMDSAQARYTVAWVDTTASGRSLGRAVLDTGDHLDSPHPDLEPQGPVYQAPRVPRGPALPFCPVTAWSARGFNTAWFHKAPRERSGTCDLTTFFHRLDAVAGWNRAIGPRGFVQYQFTVPDGSEKLIAAALEAVQRHHCVPFLGTLKRFGPGSGGLLSFPSPGWTLAIDMPARNPRLGPALDELDQDIADAGGRVYLAKDSRLSPQALHAMYQVQPWLAVRRRLDPHGVFRSDLGRRLGLCGN